MYSLPWAIEQANTTDGHDTILIKDDTAAYEPYFDHESSGKVKITLSETLPTITEGVKIETESGNLVVLEDRFLPSGFPALKIDIATSSTGPQAKDVTIKDIEFANFGGVDNNEMAFAVDVNETNQNNGALNALSIEECYFDGGLDFFDDHDGGGIRIRLNVNATTIDVLDCSFYQTKVGVLYNGNVGDLTIDDCVFSSNPSTATDYDADSYGIRCEGKGTLLIQNNMFAYLWGDAIYVDGNADNPAYGNAQQVEIYHNDIGCDSSGNAKPNLGAGIRGTNWSGVTTPSGDDTLYDSRIYDNDIANNGADNGPADDLPGIELDDVDAVRIDNNDIVGNGYFGITLNDCTDVVIDHNRIGTDSALSVGDLINEFGAVRLSGTTTDTTIELNDLAYDTSDGSGAETGAGILLADSGCRQNLITNNDFAANSSLTDENRAVVLAHAYCQSNLGDPAVSFTFGTIERDANHWDIPVTLDAGSTYEGHQFQFEYYAYSYDEATGEVEYRYLGSSGLVDDDANNTDEDGIFFTAGTDAVDVADLALGEDIRVLACCTGGYWQDNTTAFSDSATMWASAVDEHVFYNNSGWDGSDDNDAIDGSKVAFYPGDTVTVDNVTCYGKGLNGIMVDLIDFTGEDTDVDVTDFTFRKYDAVSEEFVALSTNELPTVEDVIAMNVDADGDGTAAEPGHRIVLTFPDQYAVTNNWLEVIVKDSDSDSDIYSGSDLGLVDCHVFYFGNLAGDMTDDTGSGPDWIVGSDDLDLIRANWGDTATDPDEWTIGDCDASKSVATGDLDVVRGNWGATLDDEFAAPAMAMASQSFSTSSTPAWTDAADKVYERYGLLDDDPTNDVAIDAKFWEKLYKALGLTYSA